MNFNEFFKLAMDRDTCKILPNSKGIVLNLGAGNKLIPGAVALDYPLWDADNCHIPYPDDSINQIHAYHFLEHCKYPVEILKECQRVLKLGGHISICVPYYTSQMSAHDLDHKHQFCEETWKTLFSTPYYDKNKIEWKFKIGFNLICGIAERNMCLLTQLIKVK